MQFAIIARDATDKEALDRRMKARPDHIKLFQTNLAAGKNILGGAILNDDEQMCGSIMIVDFPDRVSLDEWLNKDPYVTGHVWENIEILSFKVAGVKEPK